MPNSDLFYRNMRLGNYAAAIEAGDKALREDGLSFDVKISLKADLKNLREFGSRWKEPVTGTAFFPVLLNDGLSVIMGIKCREASEGKSDPRLAEVFNEYRDAIAKLLDELLKKSAKSPVVVFDWKLDNLRFTIDEHPFQDEAYKKLFNDTAGRSFVLALLISAVSYRLSIPLPVNIIFSGDAEKNSSLNIKWVNGLDAKSENAGKEIPGCILAARRNGMAVQDQGNFQNLPELIDFIHRRSQPDLNAALSSLPHTFITESRACIVDENDFNNIKEENISLIEFSQWDDHKYEYNHKLAVFFEENIRKFKSENGVIVSNLRLTYMPAMLAANRNLTNHIGNFLAFYHSAPPRGANADPDKKYFIAVVVRTSNGGSSHNTGDTLYYYKSS